MISKNDKYSLLSIPNIGNKTLINIIKEFPDISDLKHCSSKDLNRIISGKNKNFVIDQIKNNFEYYQEKTEIDFEGYKNKNIHVFSNSCIEFPKNLKNINNPPSFIYCFGNIDLLNQKRSIAIVGTRNSTPGGDEIALNVAKFFSEKKYNIVSGLAHGIDTKAHEGALEKKGKTTAVLVSITDIFPNSNRDLAKNIIKENGLLLSENRPGTKIIGPLFVQRDRLQSALSKVVFPIETDVEGGTMHTVGFAKEQRKFIFCPSFIHEPSYRKYLNNTMTKGIKKIIEEGIAEIFITNKYSNIPSKIFTLDDIHKDSAIW